MVTKEQFINGVLSYIDDEVIPSLPSTGKWGLGTLILLGSSRTEKIFDELTQNSFAKALDIVDNNGMIDIDRLSEAVRKSAEQYGKMSITIPVIGVLTFNEADVKKLVSHIKGGNV